MTNEGLDAIHENDYNTLKPDQGPLGAKPLFSMGASIEIDFQGDDRYVCWLKLNHPKQQNAVKVHCL